MMVAHGIVGVVIDAVLLILPIWMICTNMLWSKKMIQIILVFSVGLSAVVIGAVRVVIISKLDFSKATCVIPFPRTTLTIPYHRFSKLIPPGLQNL